MGYQSEHRKVTILPPLDLKEAGHTRQSVAQSSLAAMQLGLGAAFITATTACCSVKLAAQAEIAWRGLMGNGEQTTGEENAADWIRKGRRRPEQGCETARR